MLKRLSFLILFMLLASSAFANIQYVCDYSGRCYYRDVSNDGNPYNNANYLGLNNRRSYNQYGGSHYRP